MEDNKIVLADGTRRAWFVALIAYYVLATYLVPSTAKVERFSFVYFALVIPAWLYVAGNWRCLLVGYGTASKLLALFAILAGISGALRADYPLAYNAVFLSAMAIVILNSRVYLKVAELNWIFLATVVGSVVVYALGLTEYGFLPGQADALSCHAAMNWRVSLFRVTAESAMFSLVVLVANIAYGQRLSGWVRWLVIFVAAYFLIYSGVRSIALAALIVVPIFAFAVLHRITATARHHAVVGIVAGTVAILSVPYWLGTSDGFWENYFLKTKSCDYQIRYGLAAPAESAESAAPDDWYAWTFNRHCSAMYQLSLFAESPLGHRDLQPNSDQQLIDTGCPTDSLRTYCASCNFVTYWLARAGLAAISLLLCFIVLMAGAVKSRNVGLSLILVAFGVVSFSWGVMFVPYNLIFLLMMAIAAVHEIRSADP
jgi:hypothetical protein